MMTQNNIRAAVLSAIATMQETAATMQQAATKLLEQAATMEANLPPEETVVVPEVPGDGSTEAGANTSAITAAVVAEAEALTNGDGVGGDGAGVKVEAAADAVAQDGQAVESLADLAKSGDAPGLVVNNGTADQVGNEVKADSDLAVADGNSGDAVEAPADAAENQGEAVALETGGTKGGAPDSGEKDTTAT